MPDEVDVNVLARENHRDDLPALLVAHLGDLLEHLEALAHRVRDYMHRSQLMPGGAARHFARGLAYYDLGDFDGAIAEFTRAIQLDGGHARAYAFRALAHGYTGSPDKARADLQSAIRFQAEPLLIDEVRRALRQ